MQDTFWPVLFIVRSTTPSSPPCPIPPLPTQSSSALRPPPPTTCEQSCHPQLAPHTRLDPLRTPDSAHPILPARFCPRHCVLTFAASFNTKTPANFSPPRTDKPRPYVCGTCQRSFARLEHLKRHELTHTKEKPFECPVCKRRFARGDLLLRHQQKLHQQKLHQTSTLSSRPCSRRKSASGVAGPNIAASNVSATSMRPRANTISHIDGSPMQMIAAATNASVARGILPSQSHSRFPSLARLPIHNLNHGIGSTSPAMGQRGVQHELPKPETSTLNGLNFSPGLRTALPMAAFNAKFQFDGLFGPGSTTDPNALHYNDSPQCMALEQASPFTPSMNGVPSSQTLDDRSEWLTGLEHQMSFHTNENLVESSPSAISTTNPSGISDVTLHGPAPAGKSMMQQHSVMGTPQVPSLFAMDLNGSVLPDLLNGVPLSPQLTSQKINDHFSTPPSSLSSLRSSVVSGLSA
ncbi:hypothetical protein BGZ61DRAFT_432968 [Ilyonectria robusta]|uniref:uncharacterized protein n=1 Tax=Ilyonectria robusta TaxID=1079257 RepID=UPI001E8EE1F1|nr:uncharacterized protein BGZ61DRAFT_432968 [Ilyonectria robusta]KAH8661181.1 hypothetical protein BGZ61DRAFT_432968 [Ilyonectria robusta]